MPWARATTSGTNRIDERWLAPLAETTLFFARHETRGGIADQIMGNHRFRETDAGREVRRKAAAIVVAHVETLRPDEVRRLIDWVLPNDPQLEPAQWKRIAAGLRKRRTAESKVEIRNPLDETLVRVLQQHAEADELLAFLRTRLASARKQDRVAFAWALFDALLAQTLVGRPRKRSAGVACAAFRGRKSRSSGCSTRSGRCIA